MRAVRLAVTAQLAVYTVVTRSPARADVAPPTRELRVGIGGSAGLLTSSGGVMTPTSRIGPAMFVDVGTYVSPNVTLVAHLAWSALWMSHDDPFNTPHHTETRYQFPQAHAMLEYHIGRFALGAGLGLDILRAADTSISDGASASSNTELRVGVNVQVAIDLVRTGRGEIGAVMSASKSPIGGLVLGADSVRLDVSSVFVGIAFRPD